MTATLDRTASPDLDARHALISCADLVRALDPPRGAVTRDWASESIFTWRALGPNSYMIADHPVRSLPLSLSNAR